MAEIKERQLVDSLESTALSPGQRLSGLLARRSDLASRLAGLDAEIATLVAEEAAAPAGPSGQPKELTFAVRGDELDRDVVPAPPDVDRADLGRRLDTLRRTGILRSARDPGLEILVDYRRGDGRILSIRTRRVGEPGWVTRFQVRRRGPSGGAA